MAKALNPKGKYSHCSRRKQKSSEMQKKRLKRMQREG